MAEMESESAQLKERGRGGGEGGGGGTSNKDILRRPCFVEEEAHVGVSV